MLISDSIGKVLGHRYRLVAALGSGASAHVYLAEDVTLQRRVAVKVLQPALAREEGFLKRFRAEARAVASLNHPHVLRVFDWGEDVDGPYLVMEYLPGGSLRDILDRRFTLTVAQAARLGAEAAQGLAYAHARGLVHRDVKPANLLFDEENRVRIADFGVARALAEAAWTEPAGAMIGTARYASPEQAQGLPLDGRSDVYSLALVLFESLTGSVPFVADTTMATLMARVGAALPRHPALGALDDTLARAADPEVGHRIGAAELATRLEVISAGTLPPRPLPLRTSGAVPSGASRRPAADVLLPEPTLVAGAPPGAPPGAATGVLPGAAGLQPGAVTETPGSEDPVFVPWPLTGVGGPAGASEVTSQPVGSEAAPTGAQGSGPVSGPPPAARAEEGTGRRRRRHRRWPWALGVAAAVAAVLAVLATQGVFTPSRPAPVLRGTSLAASREVAQRDHFTLDVEAAIYSISVPAGWVVSQSPAPGTVLKEGSSITVVPSKGVPSVPVPSLSGLDCAGAVRVLAVAHLKAACPVLQSYSAAVPAGQVLNWSYDGHLEPASAPYGGTIGIATSLGPPPRPVPAVAVGGTYAQAASAIQGAGLTPAEQQEYSTSVHAGGVVGTQPASGTDVPAGSTVTVYVSLGPQMVTIPDLGGDSVSQATSALQHVGLQVGNVYGPSHGTVFDSNPASGASVTVGTSVDLYTI